MSPTDTSEKGLESVIVGSFVNHAKYTQGSPADYDREHAVDLSKLLTFIRETQPGAVELLSLDQDGPKRHPVPRAPPGRNRQTRRDRRSP